MKPAPFVFQDEEYSFQLLRTMAAAANGAAEVGECLAAAASIHEGDDETWYAAWRSLADRVYGEAKQSLEKGHTHSALSAFSRASNYYRTAEFFLHRNKEDPRILETGRLGSRSFEESIALTDLEVKKVTIPYETMTLPGYLCQVDREARPLLIVQPGFDGTMEELYFGFATAALERGLHCLVFEGPGQGSVIREQGLFFRPDWERVIGPVVDFAVQQPMVDKAHIVLCGISLGGLLAARALAFEKRIKIGIVNGAMWDFHELATQGNNQLQACLDSKRAAQEVDSIVYKMMESNATLRWAVGHGMYAFHANSPTDWMKKTRSYKLEDVIADISCQMLVVESDQDTLTGNQSQKLYTELCCPKERMVFTAAEGAGDHCQVGTPRRSIERVFNWLQETLARDVD